MKYKVLLVDDEPPIREGISESIDWNGLGFELAGACADGMEALEFIKKSPPDVLLTDICMPYLNGIELAKYVYENHYKDIKTILITGFQEFDYAQKALRFKVSEYVLKPVTPAELTKTLLKVRGELDKTLSTDLGLQKIKSTYRSNLPAIKGNFLNKLLQDEIVIDDISEKLEEFNIYLKGDKFFAAMVLGDDFTPFFRQNESDEIELGYFAIYNIVAEIVEAHKCGIAFQNAEGHTILIIASNQETKKAAEICDEICKTIKNLLDVECTIGLGCGVSNVGQIAKSYRKSKQALDYKFLLGGNRVIDIMALLENKDRVEELDVEGSAEQIIDAIRHGNESEIQERVLQFIEGVRKIYVSKSRSIFYIQSLVLTIKNEFDEETLSQEGGGYGAKYFE